MKIAFHIYSLEHGGGAERVVTNLANKFAREGMDVVVTTQCFAKQEYEIDASVRRVHTGLFKMDEKKGRIGRYLARVTNLREFFQKEQPDVVLAFEKTCIIRCLMAASKCKTKVIGCERTNPEVNYATKKDRVLMHLLFRKAAGFVFQTNGQREFFPKQLIRDSVVILNPINEKYFNTPQSTERVKEVVQSGRITKAKDQKTLIRAFAKVHEKHPDYVLKIYGRDTGDDTKEGLLSEIERLQANSYILLMGDSDQLEKELVNASVFAFSSAWEGLPNALMEAMALGLPVVATDCPCGGPATLIENGKNGLLVPVKDPDALADGICTLIENPALASKLAEEAVKIKEIANADVIFEQWKEFIQRISRLQ